MSRFIDKLTKLRQVEPQPMGFMSVSGSVEKPRMQLVAFVSSEGWSKIGAGLSAADAVLVEISKSDDINTLEKISQGKDGAPGGGWLKAASAATFKKLLNASCDFVVFSDSAALSITQKDKLGRILDLDTSLAEGYLRTINDLPLDAVLISGQSGESAVTLKTLMLFQRIAYMVNKPILAAAPASLSGAEMQALWDLGIAAVVVEIPDEKSAEKLADLKQSLEKLNPPAFRKKSRMSAVVPSIQPEAPQPQEEEEGGDGEDE